MKTSITGSYTYGSGAAGEPGRNDASSSRMSVSKVGAKALGGVSDVVSGLERAAIVGGVVVGLGASVGAGSLVVAGVAASVVGLGAAWGFVQATTALLAGLGLRGSEEAAEAVDTLKPALDIKDVIKKFGEMASSLLDYYRDENANAVETERGKSQREYLVDLVFYMNEERENRRPNWKSALSSGELIFNAASLDETSKQAATSKTSDNRSREGQLSFRDITGTGDARGGPGSERERENIGKTA